MDNKHDQEELMLLAMLDRASISADKPKVSTADQRAYLDKYVPLVNVDDRRRVATVIATSGRRDALRACPEGIVVDLSILSDDIIRKMYELLVHIRETTTTQYTI